MSWNEKTSEMAFPVCVYIYNVHVRSVNRVYGMYI